jgi:UDP-N-acetylmuramoylalanine--D-glutamate ligase
VITARAFEGKHYALYGLARSGVAAAEALLASGAKVTAWDTREEARAKAPPGTSIKYLDEAELSGFDGLVVTPGLPINRHPIAARAREAGVEIIGDIELFARARAELPPHKVVGITGTNGKSTTTALVHHILQTAGVPTTMGGNIGLPIMGQEPLPAGGVYVLELSSYQIDLTQSLDCEVAVLLNITPDHLDRYESFEAYRDSKLRLFEMSSGARVGGEQESLDSRFRGAGPALRGPHNEQNAAAAVAVCRALGVGDDDIEQGLGTYPGLPHRMERVGEKGGVLFVNDSKATNPTATAPALAAFENIRWICGGQAKTGDLDECAPYFGNVRSAYTIGEAAELFDRLLKPHMPVKNCGKLAFAVSEAAKDSAPGDIVLLSPACASFDQFTDFEDRGDRFKALVGAL